MDWKMRDWSDFSKVTITITDIDDDECEVRVKQVNIPSDNSSDVEAGWRQMIFERIATVLGYGIKK